MRYELDESTANLAFQDRCVAALREESSLVTRKSGWFVKALRHYGQRLLKHLQNALMGYLTPGFEALKCTMSGHSILQELSVKRGMSDLETHIGFLQSSIEEMILTGLPGAFLDELPSASARPLGT